MKRYVLFTSVLRSENTPCVNHVTNDEETKTMCGRTGWQTNEEPYDPGLGVDCITCAKALEREAKQKPTTPHGDT